MTTSRTTKEGRMETVNDAPGKVTQADVDRTRRDMLAGNTQFHDDKPAEPSKDPLQGVVDRLTVTRVEFDMSRAAAYFAQQRQAYFQFLDATVRNWNAHDEDYEVNRDA